MVMAHVDIGSRLLFARRDSNDNDGYACWLSLARCDGDNNDGYARWLSLACCDGEDNTNGGGVLALACSSRGRQRACTSALGFCLLIVTMTTTTAMHVGSCLLVVTATTTTMEASRWLLLARCEGDGARERQLLALACLS
jgi:hypothetical protein